MTFNVGKSKGSSFVFPASWNIFKYAWGFDDELAIVIDQTLQVLSTFQIKRFYIFIQVFYPEGSYSPGHNPRGGLGFYASPVDLVSYCVTYFYKQNPTQEKVSELTLEYEVMH